MPSDETCEEHQSERWGLHKDLHSAEHDAINLRMDGHWTLDDERWRAHSDQHSSIARNLTEYKVQSNEWRQSLSDLRSTYFPISAHDSFEREFRAAVESLSKRIDTEREERRDSQTLRTGKEEGVSRGMALTLSILAAFGTIVGAVGIFIHFAR